MSSSPLRHILGLSAYYHDSAAALLQDGELIAAAQQERFTRKKHDARFPAHAIECVSAPRAWDYWMSIASCSMTSRWSRSSVCVDTCCSSRPYATSCISRSPTSRRLFFGIEKLKRSERPAITHVDYVLRDQTSQRSSTHSSELEG
jgi:predicted NodU family carbamoyl transferase